MTGFQWSFLKQVDLDRYMAVIVAKHADIVVNIVRMHTSIGGTPETFFKRLSHHIQYMIWLNEATSYDVWLSCA